MIPLQHALKAMDQLDYVTLVIAIRLCEVIQTAIIKMDHWYQTDVKKRFKKFCLVPKIFSSY